MFPEDKMIMIHFQEGPNPHPLKCHYRLKQENLLKNTCLLIIEAF